jgi:hypothetical protein
MKTLWEDLGQVRVVTANGNIDYLAELYHALRVSGININEVEWFVWEDDPERQKQIQVKLNCGIFSKKQFGLFNRIKNKDLRSKWDRKCSVIMVFGELPESLKKVLKSKRDAVIYAINENLSFAKVNLTSAHQNGGEQVQFLKDTLEKITKYDQSV